MSQKDQNPHKDIAHLVEQSIRKTSSNFTKNSSQHFWVIPCQVNKFLANFPLDHLRFCSNFHRMCIDVLEHAVQNFAAIFSVFFFGRILKTSEMTTVGKT